MSPLEMNGRDKIPTALPESIESPPDPGDACGAGQIAPYVPPAAALTARAARVTEPHARPTSR
jgi:hypothetical protein